MSHDGVRELVAASRGLFDLRGRVALVVGGAEGLGQAIACGLAMSGAKVAIADLDGELARDTAERIAGATSAATTSLTLDVRDEQRVDEVVGAAAEWGGSLDIAFNLAGINDRRPALELGLADFTRVLDVNLMGLYSCCRAIGRRMVPQGRGKLINVASIFGHVAARDQAAYAASKGGVVQLSRVLAHEWAEHGIQVNSLSPAHIRTRLAAPVLDDPATSAWVGSRILRGEPGEPWEIIGPALFLAGDASNFVTGTSLVVDGGWLAG
ncbi:MAG: family oxidoreductase [Chthonomonadaceae bacterium]|nr:family oxidoreductase [Chthonomonadaceae bacterium]